VKAEAGVSACIELLAIEIKAYEMKAICRDITIPQF
jgi:hypothetical protein